MAWPTTNDPRTEFATLRMTEGESSDVDTEAQFLDMSRSAYIRRATANQIERDRKARQRASRRANKATKGLV